ncbi:MAG: RecQ family ATP-dependent DNA helicase, partial [Rhodospirillales bacterium]|nr:RecQ family ATP-dependent DNA helicase [Rhodospirillales bacterium]
MPALAKGGLTIVISPLVALMQDQVAALRLAGVAAETINSSRTREENVAAWRAAQAGDCRLLYMAPERLMTERMITALGRIPLSFLIVDEAHCISQWGPSFRPEYEDLKRLGELFPDVPMAAFTATADEMTQAEIVEKLFAGQAKSFIAGFDRSNIRLSVEMKRDLKRQALSFVKSQDGAPGIVYCLSRAKTERTAQHLNDNGILALPYHAGMDKRERDENQNRFMTEDGMVMVATIAFGMGIDKPDLRFVLHTDLPGSIEAYYQELGRAGRDGLPATAHMLYGMDDIRMRRMFIEEDPGDEDRKRREHKRLDALLGYCESPVCRRGALLAYFGEELDNCGNCDICLDPVETADGTEAGQKVLSAVKRTGQLFGAAHIIDVLTGAQTEKIEKFRHDELSTFGVGTEFKKPEWRSLIRQLVAGGFLSIDIQGHGGLRLGEKGSALLAGEMDFTYRPDRVK